MKIFIDSADINEIKSAWETGLIDGVTTNPTLASKINKPYIEAVREILEIVDGSVSVEVLSTSFIDMFKEGVSLAKLSKNVAVKIPCTKDGFKACKELSKEKINVNMTLCFSLNQALLAAKAGAYFVSPFIGRLDDIAEHTGDELIKEIRKVYDTYGFKTKILAASIRDTDHVEIASLLGADIATVPYKIFEEMFNHQLTDSGLKKFLKDYSTKSN